MERLMFFIQIILLSMMIASLGHAFQKFLKPGQIFNWWAIWLINMNELAKKKRKVLICLGKGNYIDVERNQRLPVRLIAWLSKPLGLCLYCNSTWISIFVFILTFGLKWELILCIGMTYLFVIVIEKIENIGNSKK